MSGDIMYSNSTKATMNAATTNSMTKGRRSHQELKMSQSEIAEPKPSSADMGRFSLLLTITLATEYGRSVSSRGAGAPQPGE